MPMENRWFCLDVECQKRYREYLKKVEKEEKKRKVRRRNAELGYESDRSSKSARPDNNVNSDLEKRLEDLEEECQKKEREIEIETIVFEKRIDMERALEEKKMKLKNAIRAKQREKEKALLQTILADEKYHLEELKKMRDSFEVKMCSIQEEVKQLKIYENQKKDDDLVASFRNPTVAVANRLKKKKERMKELRRRLEEPRGSEEESDDEEEKRKHGESDGESEEELEDDIYEETEEEVEEQVKKKTPKPNVKKAVANGLGHRRIVPTKTQMAARNGVTQKLPMFTGRPEEWPLFIGVYEASNEACGFIDVENLVRLQECLKESALESVRGQLLFPKSVSRVISKLRQLYGRPEQLLQCHLEKVNKLEPPMADRLATFIPFGTAVEQLCEHLEVAGLEQHLVNPLLVQNLVDKLPTSNKREWVRYKRRKKTVTLRTFTNFLSRIVTEACESNVSVDFMHEVKLGHPGFDNDENGEVFHSAAIANEAEVLVSRQEACRLCERTDHQLRFCQDFRNMTPETRVKLVREWKLCNVCLNDHGSVECKFRMQCTVGGCMQRHNPLLHLGSKHVATDGYSRMHNNILFRVLPVTLTFRGHSLTTLALLDEGSSITMIEKELADQLGAEGVQQKLEISWTGDVARVEDDSRRISLKISAVGGAKQLLMNEVCTVGELALPEQSLDAQEMAQRYKHLRDIPVKSYRKGRPRILIGLSNLHVIAPTDARLGSSGEPIAVESPLGWAIYGPSHNEKSSGAHIVGHHVEVTRKQIHKVTKIPYALRQSEINKEMESTEAGWTRQCQLKNDSCNESVKRERGATKFEVDGKAEAVMDQLRLRRKHRRRFLGLEENGGNSGVTYERLPELRAGDCYGAKRHYIHPAECNKQYSKSKYICDRSTAKERD